MTLSLPQIHNRSIASTPEVSSLLNDDAPVAIGVSGGKDSSAVAFATIGYLDEIGHTGPRLLIHSDLGRVEWKDSLPACQRLADHLKTELAVVRRAAGGMMERWQVRWRNNVARYTDLLCVKLILPWSTPSMRFCTSELKTAVICRELTVRYPGKTILSTTGIRREESTNRAKAPIAHPQPKLLSKSRATSGLNWNPIIEWALPDVLSFLEEKSFPLHEAYVKFGSSRVSCSFCILGSRADLRASASCPDNHDIYREMVALEIESGFAFQDSQWLGDVAPHLLGLTNGPTAVGLIDAKARSREREKIESQIPDHLLYTKGWPTVMPTPAESRLLAKVRSDIGGLYGFELKYTDAAGVSGRYAQLMATATAKRKAVAA